MQNKPIRVINQSVIEEIVSKEHKFVTNLLAILPKPDSAIKGRFITQQRCLFNNNLLNLLQTMIQKATLIMTQKFLNLLLRKLHEQNL